MPEPGFISWQRATALRALVKRVGVSSFLLNVNVVIIFLCMGVGSNYKLPKLAVKLEHF